MRRCEKIKNLCERCQQVTPFDGPGAAGSGVQATGLLVSAFEEFFIELSCKCE
jgi:hypothetical protein